MTETNTLEAQEETPVTRKPRTRKDQTITHRTRDAVDAHPPSRESSENYDHLWGPQGNLPYIPPRDGYAQRWVRAKLSGHDDVSNTAKRHRQMYRPRNPDTLPENVMLINASVDGGVIQVGSMVLMERPVEVAESHKRAIAKMTRSQMARIEADAAQSASVESGMQPYVDRQQQAVSVGRRPQIADD